jgi:trans-2,3-dihydro-3-hydroxyanthranilate isomerase
LKAKRLKNHVFYLVDVFAEEKYSGNQLAVVTGAKDLSDLQMQKIANEMHFSETTFVLSDKQQSGGYDVRIFTPAAEVPFAGHPTLGTAYVINRFVAKQTKEVVLSLKVGKIPVNFEKTPEKGEVLWMKQLSPVFGKTFEVARFSALLGLEKSDFDSKFPIQEVSTGLPFIIVPLMNLDAVKRARVNPTVQHDLMRDSQAGILVFCPETYRKENDLNVRVFVDVFGISEDPATGSGNGCLAGYLSKHRYFDDSNVDARVEQGFEIGRPSLLLLKAENKEETMEVRVGGQVVLVGKGELT